MVRNLSGRVTTGGLLILIGGLLLLSTTGIVQLRSMWGWIALVFVLVGVWALVRSEFRNLVGPVMIIAIASTVFLRNIGGIRDDVIGTWWPLFIVLFGTLLIINRSRRRQRARLSGHSGGEETAIAIFGSDERRSTSSRFRGAELVSIFGDAILDLRGATIGSRPGIVETISVFGDAEIRVPTDWEVRLETLSIFGETTDRRPARSGAQRSSEAPDVIVTGVALFGDIEIRD